VIEHHEAFDRVDAQIAALHPRFATRDLIGVWFNEFHESLPRKRTPEEYEALATQWINEHPPEGYKPPPDVPIEEVAARCAHILPPKHALVVLKTLHPDVTAVPRHEVLDYETELWQFCNEMPPPNDSGAWVRGSDGRYYLPPDEPDEPLTDEQLEDVLECDDLGTFGGLTDAQEAEVQSYRERLTPAERYTFYNETGDMDAREMVEYLAQRFPPPGLPIEAAAAVAIEQASAIPTNTTRSDVKTPEPQRIEIAATAQLKPLNWRELARRGEPPSRRWALYGWLGFFINLLVGSGGIGKTLIAQQTASALAVGRAFIDTIEQPLKVLAWFCEDEHDEIWRRQAAIARWLGVRLEDFEERLIIMPRHGMENSLVTTEYGRPMFTPLIGELSEQAADYHADVVILDNAAQLYGGGENDRHAVTFFLNGLAGALPGLAVLLLAHPARSMGSEFSGSGAWENVARNRLFLGSHLPDQQPDTDAQPDDNVRYLARRKANYSSKDYRRFQYQNGVLVPDAIEAAAAGGIIGHLYDKAAERVVLEGLKKLQEMGLQPSEGATTSRYLPRLLLDYKLGEGRPKAELAGAMRRLMLDGKLVKSVVGRYAGNRSQMFGLTVAE